MPGYIFVAGCTRGQIVDNGALYLVDKFRLIQVFDHALEYAVAADSKLAVGGGERLLSICNAEGHSRCSLAEHYRAAKYAEMVASTLWLRVSKGDFHRIERPVQPQAAKVDQYCHPGVLHNLERVTSSSIGRLTNEMNLVIRLSH